MLPPMSGRWLRRVLVTAGVCALALPSCAGGKSYHFPRVEIDAVIEPDGDLALTERRTFDFKGDFSFAFFTIEPRHAPPERIENFTVQEGSREIPATIGTDGDDRFKATWYFDASDEQRTFTIRYRVRCAVDVFSDAGHLLWQFIGTGWTEKTDLARVTVDLPDVATGQVARAPAPCPEADLPAGASIRPLSSREARAWGHGPLGGEVRFPDPGTVVFEVRDLPPETFVEGSILLPPEAVPLAFQREEPRRARILEIEGRLATEANAARRVYERNRALALGGIVGLPLLFAAMVLIARRRDRVPGVPRHLQEPPEDIHPVELAYLWAAYRGDTTPKSAYRTQLLHLAQQGAIEISPVGRVTDPEDFTLRVKEWPGDGLDREFVEFLFATDRKSEAVRASGTVNLKDVKVAGKRKTELRQWGRAVQSKTRDNAKKLSKARARLESWLMFLALAAAVVWAFVSGTVAGATGVLALAAGLTLVFVIVSLGSTAGGAGGLGGKLIGGAVVAGIVAAICLPLLLPLYLSASERGLRLGRGELLLAVAVVAWLIALRFMPERLDLSSRRRVQSWGAFRRFLKEFSSLPEAPALAVVIWERYLVYATALGVADEVERQVRGLVPPQELPAPMPGVPSGVGSLHWMRSFGSSSTPSSVHAAFVSASSARSSFGSGSGSFSSGGGFSGGFSGGGGGTGGGAG